METILNQIQQTTLVEWLGTATGLIGVYLSIKEKAAAWPMFIFCYGLYAYLSYAASLNAALVLNACFIPISVYGWWQWSKAAKGEQESDSGEGSLMIARMSSKEIRVSFCIVIFGTGVIGLALSHFAGGAMPYLDAFATMCSFTGQWWLTRKRLENWLFWLAADFAFIYLWGAQGYWVSVLMFSVFIWLATTGYLSWKKELAKA
ncbi:nicotinamide riboside transporter PnuC [Puniceicoccaceae bacterium K14]|nr:nicotinamide riboside transporter PnuC [Puniceicoccaceae bacterium K14]